MLKKLLLLTAAFSCLGIAVWQHAGHTVARASLSSDPIPVCPPEGPCPR